MSLSVQDILAKWKANTANSGPAYKAGVQAVTVNPAQKAAAAVDKYQAGIAEAVSSGKYQRGLGRVTLQSWQQAAMTTGAQRLQSGVAKGEAKMNGFLTQFIPFQAGVTAAVRAMPSTTYEDREQRMLEQSRRTRGFVRSGS